MRLAHHINPGLIEYPTKDNRFLRFLSDKSVIEYDLEFSLLCQNEEKASSDIIEHRLWVNDSIGHVWTAVSRFNSQWFVDQMAFANFENIRNLCYFSECSKKKRALFKHSLLLKGVRYYSDDRFYRSLHINNTTIKFIFKYTTMFFDIAYEKDPILGLRLYARLRDTELRMGSKTFPLSAIFFELDEPTKIINLNTGRYNEKKQLWEIGSLVIPLIFELTTEKGKPQENVVVQNLTKP